MYRVLVELSLYLLGILCDFRYEIKFTAQGCRESSGGVGQPRDRGLLLGMPPAESMEGQPRVEPLPRPPSSALDLPLEGDRSVSARLLKAYRCVELS